MRLPRQSIPVARTTNSGSLQARALRNNGVIHSDMCIGCCGYNLECKNGCRCDCENHILCEPD